MPNRPASALNMPLLYDFCYPYRCSSDMEYYSRLGVCIMLLYRLTAPLRTAGQSQFNY